MNLLSKKGLDLVLDFEAGGSNGEYYRKFLNNPTVPAWRTTSSGVTIGIGWDCGYNTSRSLKKEWGEFLDGSTIKKLNGAIGLHGETAHNYLGNLIDVTISWDIANDQFDKYTVERYYNLASKTFPGFEFAPQCVRDAIVSIVFNRGTKLTGNSRKEMMEIRNLFISKKWSKIPAQIRSMKRLWPHVKGLLRRRDAEAKFIEDGL